MLRRPGAATSASTSVDSMTSGGCVRRCCPPTPRSDCSPPLLLVVLRLVQGFAVAGELGGAGAMIIEHAPFGRRGYYASFALQGTQAGQIIAAAVFLPLSAVLPSEAFLSWGWRIPFLLSVVVVVAGYLIRRRVDETPAFLEKEQRDEVPQAPVLQVVRESGPNMLRADLHGTGERHRRDRGRLRCRVRHPARLRHPHEHDDLPLDPDPGQRRRDRR